VSLFRRPDDRAQPQHRLAGPREERHDARSGVVALGTLACPRCDAPVSPGDARLAPSDPIGCPFCAERGAVRDFLSLEVPNRPARVAVRIAVRSADHVDAQQRR
jgi:hypothetical protein